MAVQYVGDESNVERESDVESGNQGTGVAEGMLDKTREVQNGVDAMPEKYECDSDEDHEASDEEDGELNEFGFENEGSDEGYESGYSSSPPLDRL